MGSLGQQRFVLIAQWDGGCIAREAKAMVPSSVRWLDGRASDRNSYYEQAIESAVRRMIHFRKRLAAGLSGGFRLIRIRSTSLSSRKFMTKRLSSKRWVPRRRTFIWERSVR